ncbi:MAG TPA: hypothetical protein VHI13_18785 [Candidatus Kapabacteria bacterium]|nr:hypothetical protein [Candidatus Kapabacteria bacterium]
MMKSLRINGTARSATLRALGRIAMLAAAACGLAMQAYAQRPILVTRPAQAKPWRTEYLEILGVDEPGIIRHGRIRAAQVERHLLVINRSGDSLHLDLHGCCGCDYFPIDRDRLAPNDTAHLTIGYDVASLNGHLEKIVSMKVMRHSAPLEPWRAVEQMTFRSQAERVPDLQAQPSWIAVDETRRLDTVVKVVVTADSAVDARAGLEAHSHGEPPFRITLGRTDTLTHHLHPGDTLRLHLHLEPAAARQTNGCLVDVITIATRDQQARVFIYPAPHGIPSPATTKSAAGR